MKPGIAKHKFFLWLTAIVCSTWVGHAEANAICNASSPGFTIAYVPGNLTTTIISTTVSVTCTAGPKKTNIQYDLAVDNGLNALGTQNRAVLAGSFINYHVATDAACATPWQGATLIPNPRAKFALAANTTVTNVYTYYGCLLPGQLVLPPEGIYTDTVTITFSTGTASGAGTSVFTGSAFPVSILAPATCNFTTPPSNILFNYPSFSPTPVLANTTYGLNCTSTLPYTMALDIATGIVAGLNYTLALNTTGTGGASPLASVGTGTVQTFFVNGTIAAGQGGTCTPTCSGSQLHLLTITY